MPWVQMGDGLEFDPGSVMHRSSDCLSVLMSWIELAGGAWEELWAVNGPWLIQTLHYYQNLQENNMSSILWVKMKINSVEGTAHLLLNLTNLIHKMRKHCTFFSLIKVNGGLGRAGFKMKILQNQIENWMRCIIYDTSRVIFCHFKSQVRI